MGVVSLPSERSTRFGNPAWPGFKTANFAAFGAWSWVLPKNAESLRDSDALMRVAVPRRRGPAGLRDLFRFCRNCGLYALCSELSACARWGALSLPSARFACSRNAGRPLVKMTCLPFSEVDGHCSPRDAYFLANIQVSLSAISVANVFALWYDKSHKSGLSEMRVSQNNRKGKNAEQMLHDANDAKELSDDWDRAKDLCYDYNQLRPSKELFAL